MSASRPVRLLCVALPIAFVLAGCAQPVATAYRPPPTGSGSVRLMMRGSVAPGEAYGVFVYANPATCGGPQSVGSGSNSRDAATTTLAAEGTQMLEVQVLKADKRLCRMRWSFEPKAGRSYLVVASSQPGGCSSMVLDASNPDAIKREATLVRRDAPGNACVPLALARANAPRALGSGPGGEGAELPLPAPPRGPAANPADDLSGLIAK